MTGKVAGRSLAGLLLAPVVAAGLLGATGALAAAQNGLPEPGMVVRLGLPIAQAVRDVSAAVSIGLLVTAAVLLPGSGARSAALGPVQLSAVRLASIAAATWTAAGLTVASLTYADLVGQPLTAGLVFAGLPLFFSEFDLGRALGISAVLSWTATAIARFAGRVSVVGAATVVALAALLPLAWTGHASGRANHAVAIDTQIFHLIGVTVWVGGLAALALTRRRLGRQFPVVVARYSRLAGWCFGLVAMSGIVAAIIRLGSWQALTGTTYGSLLALKAVALSLLGAAGWYHRRTILPRLGDGRSGRTFVRLAAAELLVMGVAIGVAVALGRTPLPPPDGSVLVISTAEELLGYPMPPPLTVVTALTTWRPDPLWLPLALLAAIWYARAVVRLRRRGDRWGWGRTVSFLLGCVLLVVATSGSPGVYGRVLFSMHMVQHMTIGTAVPVFLVLGAPITLAMRTLPHRDDGSRGPREWLLAVVHARLLRVLGHPLVATALFIGSLVVFYYSQAFELSLRTHLGHVLMIVHFLITGYLFANVICGVDPGPPRPAYPYRLLLLIMTFSFHAFFAVSLMASDVVLGEQWYRVLSREWGDTLAVDQTIGAALGWALGDFPVAILAVALVWSWFNAERRESRRYDRQAERDGDAELAAYNDYLQQLPRREPRGSPKQ